MPYKFRNPGPWGSGSLEDLDSIDVDNNFWQAIQDIQAKASQGVGIDNIVVSGSQFTVVLTDHTLLGPYNLPVLKLIFKGEWLPNYAYLGGSIITHGGTTYFIPVNHVSEATFDPGANDGHGQNFYEVLLQYPMLTLPTGGAIGMFLRKTGTADYAFGCLTAALNDLSDVSFSTSPAPVSGDVFTFLGGRWTNAPSAAHTLNFTDLNDVLKSPGPFSGDLVYWNGSAFTYLPQSTLGLINPPAADAGSKSGSFTLDLTASELVKFTMTANCTISGFTWPGSSGSFVRRVIEVVNSGSFTLTWPASSKWPSGVKPAQTPSGTDVYIIFTTDNGSTVFGNVVGQLYS